MRLYISLSLAIVAFLAHYNNAALPANCPVDVVFIVDASATTTGTLFTSFISSLQQFVNRAEISDQNVRVGAVFMNDQSFSTRTVNIAGNRNTFINNVVSPGNFLGSNLLIGNGLEAALNLFNVAGRPTAQKIAIVVTANPSRNSVIPTVQASRLKAVAAIYAIGVQKLIGGTEYNVNELNQISTSGSRIHVAASSNSNQQASQLLNEFDTIVNLRCNNVVVNPGVNTTVSSTVCDECEAENGVGYVTYRNPSGVVDGRYFVQCKREDFGNGFIANVLRCPDSLFWHDDLKNCVGLISSDSYNGQCDSGTYLFASVACGAYFNCTDGQVLSQCCPINTGFDAVQKRCVTDNTCQFHCSDLSRAVADCDKQSFVMTNGQVNPCKYKWVVSLGVEYEMNCAAGTNFNQSTCSCTIHNANPCPGDFTDPCNADLNINFDNNQVVDARGSTVINKGGVAISNGVATFNGQNRQRIASMRYTNNDFKLPLALKIKYRETDNRQNMALVATGDCLSKPGLYVLVGNGQVTLGLHTESEGYNVQYETSANAPGANQWKEVIFHFDGRVLQGEVRTLDNSGNSIVNRTPIPPRTVASGAGARILETEGAMVLGYAHESNYPGYVGDVDEFTVWRGCLAKATPSDY